MRHGLPFLLLALLLVVGCDKPEGTIDSLRKEIAAFKAAPDDIKEANIEKSFIKLDEQIAKVKTKGETIKASELERQEANLRGDFRAAKMNRALLDAQKAIQGFGEALKDTGKNLQDAFRGTTNSGDKD